jgi:hypothetical protein
MGKQMPLIKSIPARLKKLSQEGFTAMDIAEPLVSFDAEKKAREVKAFMVARDFDLIGVRGDGLVCGYALREELAGGTCGDYAHPFGEFDFVQDTSSLIEVIKSLKVNGRCLVSLLGTIGAIVTFSDLEKPPFRMWLFGLITVAEMTISKEIQRLFPDGSWQSYLSEGRRRKALNLLQERKRRNQVAVLIDCLQLSDKGQILLRNEQMIKEMAFTSRKEGVRMFKQLETLRNHLAHSQDIINIGWDIIVELALRTERLFERS